MRFQQPKLRRREPFRSRDCFSDSEGETAMSKKRMKIVDILLWAAAVLSAPQMLLILFPSATQEKKDFRSHS